MNAAVQTPRSIVADGLYALLNPIPFGCFVAALIFDLTYAQTGTILWEKGAAWLITIGLLAAVVPRLINLTQVWFTYRRWARPSDRIVFWLNALAILAALFNAFVHSRDAYASVPAGPWLSVVTVMLLAVANIMVALEATARSRTP